MKKIFVKNFTDLFLKIFDKKENKKERRVTEAPLRSL